MAVRYWDFGPSQFRELWCWAQPDGLGGKGGPGYLAHPSHSLTLNYTSQKQEPLKQLTSVFVVHSWPGSRLEFCCVNARKTHWGKDSVIYSRDRFVLVIFLHPLRLKGEGTAQRSIEPNKLMACKEVRGEKEGEVEEENEKWQERVCKSQTI